MSTPFLTDETYRNIATRLGIDPDDPGLVQGLQSQGRYLGEQPDTGFAGNMSSFFGGAFRNIENTGRGLVDLPLLVGRKLGITDWEINERGPSFTEKANPNFSAGGNVLGFLGSMLAPEAAIGKLGFISKLRSAGRVSELGLDAAEISSMLSRGGRTTAPTIQEIASFGEELVKRTGGKQFNIFSGLSPSSMLGRGVPAALSFGAVNAAQKTGTIEDRFKNFLGGAGMGLVSGGLGAPMGSGFKISLPREYLAGMAAFGNEGPLPDEKIPGWMQNFIFSMLSSGMNKKARPYIQKYADEAAVMHEVYNPTQIFPFSSAPRVTYIKGKKTIVDLGKEKGREIIEEPDRKIALLPVHHTQEAISLDKLIQEKYSGGMTKEVIQALDEAAIPQRVQARRILEGKNEPLTVVRTDERGGIARAAKVETQGQKVGSKTIVKGKELETTTKYSTSQRKYVGPLEWNVETPTDVVSRQNIPPYEEPIPTGTRKNAPSAKLGKTSINITKKESSDVSYLNARKEESKKPSYTHSFDPRSPLEKMLGLEEPLLNASVPAKLERLGGIPREPSSNRYIGAETERPIGPMEQMFGEKGRRIDDEISRNIGETQQLNYDKALKEDRARQRAGNRKEAKKGITRQNQERIAQALSREVTDPYIDLGGFLVDDIRKAPSVELKTSVPEKLIFHPNEVDSIISSKQEGRIGRPKLFESESIIAPEIDDILKLQGITDPTEIRKLQNLFLAEERAVERLGQDQGINPHTSRHIIQEEVVQKTSAELTDRIKEVEAKLDKLRSKKVKGKETVSKKTQTEINKLQRERASLQTEHKSTQMKERNKSNSRKRLKDLAEDYVKVVQSICKTY